MTGLGDDLLQNLRRFVEEVATHGVVWGLRDEDGWAILDSRFQEGDDVMPFWSSEDFAFDAATDEWVEYEVVRVPLAEFLDRFLARAEEEHCLIGANWRGSEAGLELDAAELAQAIRDALAA